MITKNEYDVLINKYNFYHAELKRLYGDKAICITPEMDKALPEKVDNEQIADIEMYEFFNDIPEKYFLYIDEKKQIATNWTGRFLGHVYFGNTWQSNFGDIRQSVYIDAINNKRYSGIYYKSSGDYARVKLCA